VDDLPEIVAPPPGPKGQEIIDMDSRYIATTTKTSPVAVYKAKGAMVWGVDGNRYLDFTSGIGVTNTGHCHPKVVKAIQDQAAELMHFAGTDFYYAIQAKLAKRLCEVTPGNCEKKVFYTNSGAESVEAAIKLSKWSSERKRFLAFVGAFHGRTMGAVSLTASKAVHRERYFPMMPGVSHVPFAYCYRCPYKMEYPSCDLWCAKIIEEVYFQQVIPPAEVAALFMESVQGEGGYIVPPEGWVKEIRALCDRHGIVMVDDEVQAGFGRTGKWFGIDHHGVEADVYCLAKGMGSGVPIGAIVFREELDWQVQGAHSNTYGGNLVASAAVLATIDALEEEDMVGNSARMGEHLRKRLLELQEKHPEIGDVRGLGLMLATEFVKDQTTKERAIKLRDDVTVEAYKRGLILLPCGKNSLRYIPPLIIKEHQVDAAVEILDECLKVAKS
jgi:4-aminobutyrate aminotransferase